MRKKSNLVGPVAFYKFLNERYPDPAPQRVKWFDFWVHAGAFKAKFAGRKGLSVYVKNIKTHTKGWPGFAWDKEFTYLTFERFTVLVTAYVPPLPPATPAPIHIPVFHPEIIPHYVGEVQITIDSHVPLPPGKMYVRPTVYVMEDVKQALGPVLDLLDVGQSILLPPSFGTAFRYFRWIGRIGYRDKKYYYASDVVGGVRIWRHNLPYQKAID